MDLPAFFTLHPRVAVAFSGGVDSAYLLYAAVQSGAQVRAYYVKSAFQPRFELEDARRLTDRLHIDLTVLPVDILACAQVAENTPQRCYYCKKALFSAIAQAARDDGFTTLLDGTNASDDEQERPGMQALRELQVLSPLRACGLTKEEIRRLSREAGLFTWDKPAYACLATRIPAGQRLTAENLARTERAEDTLTALGLTDFRVRTVGESAKIQVNAAQLPVVLQYREEILRRLQQDYDAVMLDLKTRDA